MKYIEIQAKEALHKLKKRGLPYKYDLNIYRGCSHGCKYCYAHKSHKYLGSNSFEEEIYVKTNIVESLEKTLWSKNWSKEIINIGGVCDSYQPCEKDYKLMPEVLKLMIKYKNPIIISTKSDLILRDIDLIDELAHSTYVNIAVCITSSNAEISRKLEPGASLPLERFKTIGELGKTKANTGFHLMPILPMLADDKESLETLVKWASQAKATYMLTGILYLTGGIRPRYLNFIKKEYPMYYQDYLKLYQKGSAHKDYKTKVYGFLIEMKKKYQVSSSYAKHLPNKKTTEGNMIPLF